MPPPDREVLLALARELAGSKATWSQSEREVLKEAAKAADPALVAQVRSAIARGEDPLGSGFCALRPPQLRRAKGQTFTPLSLVDAMVEWSMSKGVDVRRVVDPGAGSGRFTLRALRKFERARAVVVESDPEVAVLLRANLAASGLAERADLVLADFRELELPRIAGSTLFIGNPPYVRHHDIEPHWKQWYGQALARFGLAGSRLAGLHAHFFVRTLELAEKGDVGCYVTAAEWLDVNYGRALRELLADGLGGAAIHLFGEKCAVFGDAMVSAVVTRFSPHGSHRTIRFARIDGTEGLQQTSNSTDVARSVARVTPRWSVLARPDAKEARPSGFAELGELFRVSRGQVTGSNRVWVQGPHAPLVPSRFLFPCVTDAREIVTARDGVIADSTALRRVVDLPADMRQLEDVEREQVEDFLEWARRHGAHEGYIARHRRPWWRVRLGEPAPVVMTYMGRRPPAFAVNRAQARLINIAHGLYPRAPLDEVYLRELVAWLNANAPRDGGRVYAGGLTKFEPSEAMRLAIPAPVS